MEKEGIQGEYPFVLFYEEVTDRELNKVLKALEQIPNEKERDDAMQIVLKAASESITLERLKKILIIGKKRNNMTGEVTSNLLKRR